MLLRRALTIASPYSIPQRPVEGTMEDLYGWQDLLKSPQGGAWTQSELAFLIDPSPDAFRRHMAWVNDADIAYVLVAAHGYSEPDMFGNIRNRVVVGRNFHPDLASLIPRDPRWGITLVDACRDFVGVAEASKLASIRIEGLGEIGEPMSGLRHRQYYEALVQQVPPKREIAVSCDFNESAQEDPDLGGLFSVGVRNAAEIAPPPNGGRTHRTFRACVNSAKKAVQRWTYGEQRPQFSQTRGVETGLPFSVSVASARVGRSRY